MFETWEVSDFLLVLTTLFSGTTGIISLLNQGRVNLVKAQNEAIHKDVKAQAADIKVLEKNTNSLVAKAEAAAHLAGKVEEKMEAGERRQVAAEAAGVASTAVHLGDTVTVGPPEPVKKRRTSTPKK